MNIIFESLNINSFDMNLFLEKNYTFNDNEYNDWNEFISDIEFSNDILINFLSFEKQECENSIFIHEFSLMKSSQSFIDILKYQFIEKLNDEFNKKNFIDLDNINKFLFKLSSYLFTHNQFRK